MSEQLPAFKPPTACRNDSLIVEIGRAGLIAGGALVAMFVTFWMKRKLSSSHRTHPHSTRRYRYAEQMRQTLSRAIVGNSQHAILSIFGPPRSSAGFSAATPPNTKNAFLRATTWYYMLDNTERRAMVIEFENGIARRAEFLRGVTTHV